MADIPIAKWLLPITLVCLLIPGCGDSTSPPTVPQRPLGADSPEEVLTRLVGTEELGFTDIIRVTRPDEQSIMGFTVALIPLITIPLVIALAPELEEEQKRDLSREHLDLMSRYQMSDLKSLLPDKATYDRLTPEEQLEKVKEALPGIDWVTFAFESWTFFKRLRGLVGGASSQMPVLDVFKLDRATLEVDGDHATVLKATGDPMVLVREDGRWYVSLLESEKLRDR